MYMVYGKYVKWEWQLLLDSPHWVYHALEATEKGNIFTQSAEAKALRKFLKGYETQSPMVKAILTGQDEADEKLEGDVAAAQSELEKIGYMLEQKSDEEEGDAVRDFLMEAGEAVAKAARDQAGLRGTKVSSKEKETLAMIATALKATDADKKRRREEAEAAQQAEDEKARKEREATAMKKAEEQKKREAAAAKKAAAAAAAKEAKAKAAEEARKKAEAEEKRKQWREEQKKREEEAAARKEMEALKAEAEAAKKEAEAAKAEAAKAKAEAEAAKAAAAAPAAEEAAPRIYVVKPGDTLSGIAKKVYGKAGRWPEIYEANKDRIKDPNLIRPGWELRIPD
jgi:LysM repeat protein